MSQKYDGGYLHTVNGMHDNLDIFVFFPFEESTWKTMLISHLFDIVTPVKMEGSIYDVTGFIDE